MKKMDLLTAAGYAMTALGAIVTVAKSIIDDEQFDKKVHAAVNEELDKRDKEKTEES